MKNVKNLFGMAVMATALVGCSSNDNLNPNANEGAGKAGTAYASFKINLPTVSGTRAPGDPEGKPDFNPGTAAEYEVKNGTILIFNANTDKYVTRVELGTMNPWKEDTDNKGITTAASVTVQLSDVALDGNYKALVLLNNNSETTPKVTLPTTSDTYTTWSAKASNANATEYVKTDGIFMANAPKYTGTTTEPTTLVDIKEVYASREEAQANASTVVCVERGLAKVTMKNFDPDGYTIAAGNTYAGDKVEIKKWKLDVTNKSTFPVHQLGSLSTDYTGIWSDNHFFDETNTIFKRVYWGIDPNYSNNELFEGTTTPAPAKTALKYCEDNFNMITNAQVDGKAGDANPQYCLENTFNLDNMKQGQTTRVVFKAVYTPKTFTSGETFYKVANNTAIWHEADLKQQILTLALKAMNITDHTEQRKYDVDLSKGSNISGAAGQHLIQEANITYSGTPADSKVKPAIVNTVNEKLGLKVEGGKITTGISTYLNGEAYYIARIKHFNELTPWTAGDAYGTKNDKYLGRYGVLRNNWYELSVSKISNLGYPEVPEVKPNLPDDENDKYINVEVKILDWAKRSQSIDL
ncbi:Mfa1 family fimbria major subunit [Prevotella merdae]|uniref:Mfa1 family fimbria major subunit n=1 Tax=Prevotella merdae TaxID=2079531 RepID=UPI003F7FFA33